MKSLLGLWGEVEIIYAKLLAESRCLIDGNSYNVKVNSKAAVSGTSCTPAHTTLTVRQPLPFGK